MAISLFACTKADDVEEIVNSSKSDAEYCTPIDYDTKADDVEEIVNSSKSDAEYSTPIDYDARDFESKHDLVVWLNAADFSGAANKTFGTIFGDVASGKRNIYSAYRDGKELETYNGYTCIISNGFVQFIYRVKDSSAKGCQVNIQLSFPDYELHNETDPLKVMKGFWPNFDESNYNRKSVKFMGNDTEIICFSSSVSNEMFYNYFVYKDVLVNILLYDEEDSIEDILDGFELRPIDLTAKKE